MGILHNLKTNGFAMDYKGLESKVSRHPVKLLMGKGRKM